LLLCITETVKEEAIQRLPAIVNRYFDKIGIKAHAVREYLYLRFRERLFSLIKYCKVEKVNSDKNKIERMYKEFSRIPQLLAKLKKLQAYKRRKSLFPGDTDMQILSEADDLGAKYFVHFITDDRDFLDFKTEIETELSLKITALLDLPHFFDE